MSEQFHEYEPVPDYMADTGPVQAVRDEPRRPEPASGWRRVFSLFSLLGAVGLTIATIVLLISPGQPDAPDNPVIDPQQDTMQIEAIPTEPPNLVGEPVESITVLPTMPPDALASLLSTPIAQAGTMGDVDIEAVRDLYNPFTIIPERSRSEVETYTIVSGDTIFSIAERYGLEPETIVWGNDQSIVHGLRPGREINILPVDGVYHQVLGDETLAEIAAEYGVDPYTIIDSEFNDLFGQTPEDVLPSGTWVVIPGAQREQIAWNPVVERVEGSGSGGQSSGGRISFAPGEPGSCGLVDNPGGGGGWWNPLSNYTWIRGFSGVHSGVDLSAPVGTPVAAANSGTVIYSGWSNWGYGYTIVLAHGPFTTLYGHLSAIYTSCGQYISAGSTIGAVGSSGQSTGPHLHFEIRYNDVPQDPTYTMAF